MKRALLTGAAFCAALLATNPAHADPVQVRNGQFEAVVSADQMSRIAIEGDKIVEHWDVMQDVPADSPNPHSPF